MNIYDIEVRRANGENYTLEHYRGKVLLVVNTATKCGLVGQFEDLEKLYRKYKDQGFEILGFPSNQFKQELPSAGEATEACRMSYGVTFPMHEIVKVNGKDANPLFKFLTQHSKGVLGSNIKWNFTKFLIDRQGNVVKRFVPTQKPSKFENEISKYL